MDIGVEAVGGLMGFIWSFGKGICGGDGLLGEGKLISYQIY